MKTTLPLFFCLLFIFTNLPVMAQNQKPDSTKNAGSEAANSTPATPLLNPAVIKASIQRAMSYLEGKEGTPGNGPQYSDYVVFCGLPVVNDFPEYADILETYKIWITKNDRYIAQLPYQSICHVMALDLIGEKDKAVEIYSQLAPMGNDGKWDNVPFHIGWYLYGSIVAEDKKLLDSTWLETTDLVENHPHR